MSFRRWIVLCISVALLAATLAGLAPAGSAAPPGESPAEAVVFAVEALAEADLLDPEATMHNYRGVEEVGDTLVMTFDAFDCVATAIIEVCRNHPDGDSELVLETVDQTLRIVGATGPMSAQQRGRLLGQSRGVGPPVEATWEFPAPVFNANRRVAGSPVWTGDLGVPGGSACSAELVDDAGVIVWRSTQDLYIETPDSEGSRAGGIAAFPAVPGSVDGTPRISCTPWSGEGWQVAGEPSVFPVTRRTVAVGVDLLWEDTPFPRVAARCHAVAFDPSGARAGEAEKVVAGASPYDEAPVLRRGYPILVEVPDSSAVAAAEVTCVLAPIQDLEADE